MTAATAKPTPPAVAPARQRDAERSQQLILAAAITEFSSFGKAGARMDRIAEQAQIDKRLIYYYFKSKDELFARALEQVYSGIREAERELQLETLAPSRAIRRLVEFTWDYYLEHPEFITLLNSENLHGGVHLAGSERIRSANSPLIHMLRDILARGEQSGEFRSGVDPLQLYVSIAALCYFYLSNRHTLSAVFGRDLTEPRAKAERLSHNCDVILGYLLRN